MSLDASYNLISFGRTIRTMEIYVKAGDTNMADSKNNEHTEAAVYHYRNAINVGRAFMDSELPDKYIPFIEHVQKEVDGIAAKIIKIGGSFPVGSEL
ncbi:hypothetical protein KW787_00145 [Candidatus Pacearchaeota archaeon]|nr:hypothetical protein [Candidatus Pacearchaeota archaeon]